MNEKRSLGIDLGDFLSPDFEVKKWVNANLVSTTKTAEQEELGATHAAPADLTATGSSTDLSKGPPIPLSRQSSVLASGGSHMEQVASNLVHKLQLLGLEIAGKLEQISMETVQNMPRALHDIEAIRQSAQKVKASVESAKREFYHAEQNTGGTFKDLAKLDLVRGRMMETRQCLKEAETWNTLSNEMHALMSAGDYGKAADRLDEARRSLAALGATDEHDDRRELLVRLQNNLNDAIKPQLTTVLSTHDGEGAKRLYNVYTRVGMPEEFTHQYYALKKQSIARLWDRCDDRYLNRGSVSGSSDEFTIWLSTFYEEVELMMRKELTWCEYVFPMPYMVAHDLLREIFSSLEPSLASRLQRFVEMADGTALPRVVQAYQATVQFGIAVEKMLVSFKTETSSHPVLESDSADSIQRPAKNVLFSKSHTWGTTIFEAFLPFQQSYGEWEERHLLAILPASLPNAAGHEPTDSAREMEDSVAKVFTAAEASLTRCKYLTLGFGVSDLLVALRTYLARAMNGYQQYLEEVYTSITAQRQKNADGHATYRASNDVDFGMETQEWNDFQVGLKLLGVCSTVERKLETFIRTLSRTLRPFALGMVDSDWDSVEPFWAKDSAHTDECWASFNLLRYSTLNSHDLRKVLENLDADSGNNTRQLFSNAFGDIETLTRRVQRFIFETLLWTVEDQLKAVPAMTVWEAQATTTAGPFNLDVPQFSLSPSPYITRVGEHLLTIPQHLDLFATDEALGHSIHTLTYLEKDDLEKIGNERSVDIGQLWIMAISRGMMDQYIQNILKIHRLSPHGTKQLSVDVGYISNVFLAMDIEPSDPLRRLQGALNIDGEDFGRKYEATKRGEPESEEDAFTFADDEIARRIAAARGFNLGSYP
ncbi:hypothetical protein HDU85_004595 [Gaertneriomyces sp. JEL0708]|nr:hypothetical protein HDU85_004595 [Gaertneriomyces sp. JEL0708]